MKIDMYYVYFVRRDIKDNTIRCTQMVGKVGKGTGGRIDAYNTPYGTMNLIKDKWNCSSEVDSLLLEKTILDILELRGWLEYHAPSAKKKIQKRTEIVSFIFRSDTQSGMIKEYMSNMKWIYSLIIYYHDLLMNKRDILNKHISVINSLKGKMINGIIHNNDISIFSSLGDSSVKKNMSTIFNGSISLKQIDDKTHIIISNEEPRSNGCICM